MTMNSIGRFAFTHMKDVPHWVGVAFKRGSMSKAYDVGVMSATMGPYTHTELLIGNGPNALGYTAYIEKNSGFMRSLYNAYDPREWDVWVHPLSDSTEARTYALMLSDAKIRYNTSDLWQCCVQVMLPLETELNCDLIDSNWNNRGLFCSQACLLFLRHLTHTGALKVSDTLQHHVNTVHSRGCSPNALHGIVKTGFSQIGISY